MRRPYRRSVSLVIGLDNVVEIRAPKGFPAGRIPDLLRERAGWIRRVLDTHERFLAENPPKKYVHGEGFAYLGEDYPLEILSGEAGPLSFDVGRFRLSAPERWSETTRSGYVREVFASWYRERAEKLFGERLAFFEKRMGLKCRSFALKSMRSRWGSCGRDGRVHLNWKLILTPAPVIDYVIVHELSHLRHADHSERFWRTVRSAIPHEKESRAWLRRNATRLALAFEDLR